MTKHLGLALVLALAGCPSAGMTPEVHADIAARLQSAQTPIATCYQKALTTNRKLRGMMIVQLAAAADTGQFSEITLRRDEIQDPVMKFCVIGELAKLKLEKPQKARIVVESIPLKFDWSNP
jgi:hypothetical protein